MSSETSHFFSADRPIERLADDRLQRGSFAKSIAQAITTWHGTDSLVIALYGGWGDGKSSVKGMVIDAMKQDQAKCPSIGCLLIEGHLNKLPTGSERFLVLQASFDETNGIYLPACLLRSEGSRGKEHQKDYEPRGISREQRGVLTEEQLNVLGRICLRHFEQAATSGVLQTHPKLQEVLAWWLRWSAPSDAAKVYFRKLVATDEGLLTLFEQYLGRKLSDDRPSFLGHLDDISLSEFGEFMSVDEINARVAEVARNPLSARQKKLCTLFMEIYAELLRMRSVLAATVSPTPGVATAPAQPEPSTDGSPSPGVKPKE
jgi:hypothetical protein